jgi:uncharacterized protein
LSLVSSDGGSSMEASSYLSPKVRKGSESAITGRGLFAEQDLKAGEVVAVKGGHILERAAVEALPEELFATEIQIADNLHLAATTPEERDGVMLFLNHSCEPNVGFAGNIVLITMRDVVAGEELTVDYAMFDIIGGAMACACGRSRCRGTVTGDDWRRAELQERYRGYFSWYLQRRIDDGR